MPHLPPPLAHRTPHGLLVPTVPQIPYLLFTFVTGLYAKITQLGFMVGPVSSRQATKIMWRVKHFLLLMEKAR